MKILQINKYHYLKGGAERSYFNTIEILEKQGHEVAVFSMCHPQNKSTKWSKYFISNINYHQKQSLWKKIKLAGKMIYNREAVKNLEKLIKDFQPEVAHLHNIYHQLSPAIINVLKKHNIPIIMTLHDYKIICPNYSLFARGEVYNRCKNGKFYQCFFDRCIDNLWIKSLLGTIESYWHKKTYQKVDLFIAPSKFLKNKFKDYGFKGKIVHLPYAVMPYSFDNKTDYEKQDYFLYAGRLSQEKGVDVLINAFVKLKNNNLIKLIIVGDGPTKKRLQKLTKKLNVNKKIIFVGHKNKNELFSLILKAKAVVVPSVWPENLPFSVLEAMSLTKLVICSKIGGLVEMIKNNKNGLIFSIGDIDELTNTLENVIKHPELAKKLGQNARNQVINVYNPENYYQKLMQYYQEIIK